MDDDPCEEDQSDEEPYLEEELLARDDPEQLTLSVLLPTTTTGTLVRSRDSEIWLNREEMYSKDSGLRRSYTRT